MIEFCSVRRMIIVIIFVLCVSLFVFILEGYIEESRTRGEQLLKEMITWDKPVASQDKNKQELPSHAAVEVFKNEVSLNLSSSENIQCYKSEPYYVITNCARCSSFETLALKSEYCAASGYYDKLNCTKSGHTGLRPCLSKSIFANTELLRATVLTAFLSISSYLFVAWRRSILERLAFARVQQHLDG
ncbi:hypothetical protein AB6A40_009056 [Gnathostoma spinigerum]|uniref:Protein JTB n=1 Tax=Gnathostoma spinigerum TaxID=75299 RepID=A0ABD6ET89_9BILA